MNQDAIDRALRDEPEVTPSRDFSHRVMRTVRTEAANRKAMPFPWQLLGGGLALSAGLTLFGVLSGAAPPDAALAEPPAYLTASLAWLSATLAGSLALAWWSMRFAGRS